MGKYLDQDKQVTDEFGIDASVELDVAEKLGFARAQFGELAKILWRNRLDLILSNNLVKSDDEDISTSARSKVREYRLTIKQLGTNLKVLSDLIKELEPSVPTE